MGNPPAPVLTVHRGTRPREGSYGQARDNCGPSWGMGPWEETQQCPTFQGCKHRAWGCEESQVSSCLGLVMPWRPEMPVHLRIPPCLLCPQGKPLGGSQSGAEFSSCTYSNHRFLTCGFCIDYPYLLPPSCESIKGNLREFRLCESAKIDNLRLPSLSSPESQTEYPQRHPSEIPWCVSCNSISHLG